MKTVVVKWVVGVSIAINVILFFSVIVSVDFLKSAKTVYGVNTWEYVLSADGEYKLYLPFSATEKWEYYEPHNLPANERRANTFRAEMTLEQIKGAFQKKGYYAEMVGYETAQNVVKGMPVLKGGWYSGNDGVKIAIRHKRGTAYYFITDYIFDGRGFSIIALTPQNWVQYF